MQKLKFEYLPLDKIDISISNVRKTNLEEYIDELYKSIKEIGIQQPVVVFEKPGGRFELIIGQRRYLACKKGNLEEIPALITTVKSETEAIIKSFSENIHRLDLEYRDKMQVATELLSKLGSINKVALNLGVNPQTVRNYLGYSVVPNAIKKLVDDGKLSASTATRIAKHITDEEKAVKIAEKIKETPRSAQRGIIIDIARENPNKSPEDIIKIANNLSMRKKITIYLTQRVYEALTHASREYQSDKEDVVTEVIEEWLKKRGFIE